MQQEPRKNAIALARPIEVASVVPSSVYLVRRVVQAARLAPGGCFVAYQVRAHVAGYLTPHLGAPQTAWDWRNVPPMRVFRWLKLPPSPFGLPPPGGSRAPSARPCGAPVPGRRYCRRPMNAPLPRELWSGRTAFDLATVGSAIGLGNSWRSSYVAGENGGGAFPLAYLVVVAALGLPLMLAEFAFGRRARTDSPAEQAIDSARGRAA